MTSVESGVRGEATDALRAVSRFVIHTVVGTILFLLIGVAALALHQLVVFVETHGASAYVVAGLKAVELVLFSVDVCLLGLFLLKETAILVVQICREFRSTMQPTVVNERQDRSGDGRKE